MFVSNRVTHRAPLIAGLLILLIASCSKAGDRAVSQDTVAPATTTGAAPETAATQVDSTAASANHADSTTKPPVKPSIDPGRKRTTPAPAKKVAVAADSVRLKDSASTAPATQAAAPNQPLQYDAGSNTVTFQLIGGPNGFQFNGHSSGNGTLTLPSKANVVLNFINKDGTPHSAEVISGEGALPNAGGDPAIPRAYTNQLLQGLPQEASDVMRFQVPESGTYRIFCGVPGHGLSGMWIWMKVDPAAKTPSFGATKS